MLGPPTCADYLNSILQLQETAAGILYLHQSGIIHGDIKAANVLVSDDVRALLCDFGLARSEVENTSTGLQGVGTIRWQSPELLTSDRGKTFQSDVWALGMTIYEVRLARKSGPCRCSPTTSGTKRPHTLLPSRSHSTCDCRFDCP